VAFEPGAKLAEIEEFAFYNCLALRSMSIPLSVQSIDGRAFIGAVCGSMAVDDQHLRFSASGGFLIENRVCVIRYLGAESEVSVPSEIERLARYSFCQCRFVATLTFGGSAKLLRIEEFAFANCFSLRSICVPASVLIIAESAFSECHSLSGLTFKSESKLTRIEESAFSSCSSIECVCVPASVEYLGQYCFAGCSSLSEVTFESASKLGQIDECAFVHCPSLKQICVPNSLPPVLD
jgi:hypothetical protein